MSNVTAHPNKRGDRIGVNRDDQPVGHAVRVNRKGQSEQWTAFVNLAAAPFETTRTGFASGAEAVRFIGVHGAKAGK